MAFGPARPSRAPFPAGAARFAFLRSSSSSVTPALVKKNVLRAAYGAPLAGAAAPLAAGGAPRFLHERDCVSQLTFLYFV
jgi:hypothetical protein